MKIDPVAGEPGGLSSYSGGLFLEVNVEPHGGETAHQLAGGPRPVQPVEIRRAEILIERAIAQHVPDRDQDLMGNRDRRAQLSRLAVRRRYFSPR